MAPQSDFIRFSLLNTVEPIRNTNVFAFIAYSLNESLLENKHPSEYSPFRVEVM